MRGFLHQRDICGFYERWPGCRVHRAFLLPFFGLCDQSMNFYKHLKYISNNLIYLHVSAGLGGMRRKHLTNLPLLLGYPYVAIPPPPSR